MSKGITTEDAVRDVRVARMPAGDAYEYWRDANGNLSAVSFDATGRIVGTQAITISVTVGEFRATE